MRTRVVFLVVQCSEIVCLSKEKEKYTVKIDYDFDINNYNDYDYDCKSSLDDVVVVMLSFLHFSMSIDLNS